MLSSTRMKTPTAEQLTKKADSIPTPGFNPFRDAKEQAVLAKLTVKQHLAAIQLHKAAATAHLQAATKLTHRPGGKLTAKEIDQIQQHENQAEAHKQAAKEHRKEAKLKDLLD